MSQSGRSATLTVRVWYPARSETEAKRAENGTLDPAWFDGDGRIRRIFNVTAGRNDRLTETGTSALHSDRLSGRVPSTPRHGWIVLEHSVGWINYLGPEDRIVVGQQYLDALDEDWTLVVWTPADWTPSRVNGDPVRAGASHGVSYRWTVGDSSPALGQSRAHDHGRETTLASASNRRTGARSPSGAQTTASDYSGAPGSANRQCNRMSRITPTNGYVAADVGVVSATR